MLFIFKTRPLISLGSLIFVLLLGACSKPEPVEEPVRSVRVMAVALSTYETKLEFAGEVRPRVESRLGFRVAGKLTKREAEVGQRVKAGQLLAQLDPQDFALSIDAAQAQLGSAVTQRDLAAADYKRFKELKDQSFISGADLERRDATFKAAQAQVDQAQAQLKVQRNQGRYTQLLADVSGVITAVEAEPGQVVSAGMPIVRIAVDGQRDVVFSVPEDKIAAVLMGAEMEVRSWSSAATLNAKVREISASADPVTRTYQVKVALENKQDLPIGSTASVLPAAMGLQNAAVIKLPTSALKQQGNSSAVWILDKTSMTVKSQGVQIATVDGNEAVVTAGLEPGMWVVTAGVHVLAPGQKVTLYQEKGAPSPAGKP